MAFSVELSMKVQSACDKGFVGASSQYLYHVLLLLSGATVVILGGLGSCQNLLSGVDKVEIPNALTGARGFVTTYGDRPADTTDVFRFHWFTACFQAFVVLFAWYVYMTEKLPQMRNAVVGLFIVATLLTIQSSDGWLTASETDYMKRGLARDRSRTTVAGYIIAAAMNAVFVFMAGQE